MALTYCCLIFYFVLYCSFFLLMFSAFNAVAAAIRKANISANAPAAATCSSYVPAAAVADGSGSGAESSCVYELVGVVVHSGTSNFGHYFSYIRYFRAEVYSLSTTWLCHCWSSTRPALPLLRSPPQVLELGAGLGLCSLVAAKLGMWALATDFPPKGVHPITRIRTNYLIRNSDSELQIS